MRNNEPIFLHTSILECAYAASKISENTVA